MQNLLSRIFQSRIARPVVKWFRSSRRAQPERPISPEEFFAAFTAMMNNPEQARLYRKTLMGMVMPFEGAMPCNTSATDVGPGTFGTGTGCSPQGGNYQFGSTTVASQVGIGVAPSYPLHVESSPTATSGNQISFYGLTTANPTGNSSAAYLASLYQGITKSGNAADYTGNFYSFSPQTYHQGTGTMTNVLTLALWSENSSTGTITTLHGIDVAGRNVSSGSIVNNVGVYIHDLIKSAGSVTNNTGLYIEPQTAGSNNYAIYSAGGNNYFGGNVGIGATTPSQKLEVSGNIKISGSGNGIVFPDNTTQTTAAVSGSGTDNFVAVYSAASSLESSIVYATTKKVGVGATNRLSTLTVKGNPTITATGTVSISNGSPTVTGGTSGSATTFFLTEVGLGDRITISGVIRTVVEITDDHTLKVDGNFTISSSSVSMTIMPSIFRADNSSGKPKFIVSDDGLLGIAGTPIHDNDAVGFVFCNLDTRVPGTTNQTILTDDDNEMRGYQSTMRYTRTTADANFTNLGWDVFGYGAAVSLENMALPSADREIRGSMKPFQSELYFMPKASGAPDYKVVNPALNYVASLSQVDYSCEQLKTWAGVLIGQPNFAVKGWTANITVYLEELKVPTAVLPSGSGFIWQATGFPGGANQGSSGSTQPSWPASPTPGVTTFTDGAGITWICYAPITIPMNRVSNGYGIWVQTLQDEATTLVKTNAAAIQLDGLEEYGRIRWGNEGGSAPSNYSAIYQVSESGQSRLEFFSTGYVCTASGIGFKVGGSGANAGCDAGSYSVAGALIIDSSQNITVAGSINVSTAFKHGGNIFVDSNRGLTNVQGGSFNNAASPGSGAVQIGNSFIVTGGNPQISLNTSNGNIGTQGLVNAVNGFQHASVSGFTSPQPGLTAYTNFDIRGGIIINAT